MKTNNNSKILEINDLKILKISDNLKIKKIILALKNNNNLDRLICNIFLFTKLVIKKKLINFF